LSPDTATPRHLFDTFVELCTSADGRIVLETSDPLKSLLIGPACELMGLGERQHEFNPAQPPRLRLPLARGWAAATWTLSEEKCALGAVAPADVLEGTVGMVGNGSPQLGPRTLLVSSRSW